MTRRFLVAAAMVAIAGCSLDKQAAPPISGPSELGLSLTVTATPDVITQDGQSRSTIDVVARDGSGQPWRGTVRAQTMVGNTEVDYGTLSSKVQATNADGKASFFYQAPAAPPVTATDDTLITIAVTPVGTNYAGALARTVDVRLARPGVIIPPGDGPVAKFFFSPTAPRSEDDVFFDASASTGKIVSYQWSFGDGRTDSSSSPTTRHHYEIPAEYNVVLTVVDDKGRSNTSAPQKVTIASLAIPKASFVMSPSSPKVGDVINFNASLSTAEVGHTIVKYVWDFGDGSPLATTGAQTTKAYAQAKTYTIVLQVTDSAGRVGSVTGSVTVAP